MLTSEHEVPGSNSAKDGIKCMTVRRLMARNVKHQSIIFHVSAFPFQLNILYVESHNRSP